MASVLPVRSISTVSSAGNNDNIIFQGSENKIKSSHGSGADPCSPALGHTAGASSSASSYNNNSQAPAQLYLRSGSSARPASGDSGSSGNCMPASNIAVAGNDDIGERLFTPTNKRHSALIFVEADSGKPLPSSSSQARNIIDEGEGEDNRLGMESITHLDAEETLTESYVDFSDSSSLNNIDGT